MSALDLEMDIKAKVPIIKGGALIVPIGFLNYAKGNSKNPLIDAEAKKKTELFHFYKEKLKNFSQIRIMPSPKNCLSNFWLQTIFLSEKDKKQKNIIIKDCFNIGIKVRPLWDLISSFKMYKNCPKMNLISSKNAYERIINLPSSSFLIK